MAADRERPVARRALLALLVVVLLVLAVLAGIRFGDRQREDDLGLGAVEWPGALPTPAG